MIKSIHSVNQSFNQLQPSPQENIAILSYWKRTSFFSIFWHLNKVFLFFLITKTGSLLHLILFYNVKPMLLCIANEVGGNGVVWAQTSKNTLGVTTTRIYTSCYFFMSCQNLSCHFRNWRFCFFFGKSEQSKRCVSFFLCGYCIYIHLI